MAVERRFGWKVHSSTFRPSFFYFSAREYMLAITILSSVAWAFYGWDGTTSEFPLQFKNYGIGIHWSTIQTFALFFYLFMINLQNGGRSPFVADLVEGIRLDFQSIWIEIRTLSGVLDKARFKEQREKYRTFASIGPVRATAFSFLMIGGALFAFEVIWVPLYDYFQFGSVLWPVYMATVYNIPNFALIRNVGITGLCFLLAPLVFKAQFWGAGESKKPNFSVKWRFDDFWVSLVMFDIFLWLYWITGAFPHSALPALPGTIWPKQDFFPQTDYTYYSPSIFLKPYSLKFIEAFYIQDNYTHFMNVITKYLTYLVVCYPALVRVRLAAI